MTEDQNRASTGVSTVSGKDELNLPVGCNPLQTMSDCILTPHRSAYREVIFQLV
jgi:hypothetical protein